MSKCILLTGSSGRIGRGVTAELLRRGHDVRGFDLVATPGLADMVVGTLTDRAAIDRAMQGRDTLIHLAATPDDDEFETKIVPNNIIGLHHVMESARAAGVRRLILASTTQLHWFDRMRGRFPLTETTPISPRYWYGASKAFLEGAGKAFSESFGLEVLAIRLGWCPRTKEQAQEILDAEWAQDVYLSSADAGRFFALAAESPRTFTYETIFCIGKPLKTATYDPAKAKELLGYEPQDAWPVGSEDVIAQLKQ
ncbi:MAG: NAD(P)-dependent oxidoreductase [Gemmataceae bacterium]|nr:NAD(P)-dependent oxidoreductase [Gemmataceae bacterium]